MKGPRGQPQIKIKNETITDEIFQQRMSESMIQWKQIRNNGLDVLTWWELIVKPGLRSLAIQRNKEMNKEERGKLNLFLIKNVPSEETPPMVYKSLQKDPDLDKTK